MLKNNKSMVVASMLCASVMVGLYSAPVFAAPVNGDELKIEGSDGNFVIKEVVPGKTMIYTEVKNGDDTLYLDPASGNLSTKGTISVGGLDGNSIKTVIDGTSGSIAVGLKNGVPQINLDADTGEVNAKTFNGVSLATNGDEVLVNGIDVKAMGNNVAGNVVADGLGRFGSLNGPNVRMEKGELTINSSATNKVVSMSAEGLKMYGDDGKLNVLLTREGGLALNQNLSVRGNMSIDGTINGATITAESFNGVNIGELANSVEGIDKVSANVAGITRPSENETIIEGKVAINSVGNVYTPGSIIAENGFSTGNGNFAVSGATGDITTKGAINGVSLSENGIKFGKDGKTQILASVAGDAIINGNTIGFDGINASGGLSVGVLDKKFGVDADGNVEAQGTLSVANGAFKVDKDGTVTSKVGNSTLYVGADQAGMKNGNNAVVVDNNGVLLGNAFGSNVRVGENGVTFTNGEAGSTIINGGNISNGKFSVDKDGNIQAATYNGINIEDLKSDVEASNKNVAGIKRRESAAGDGYVTEIEGRTMIASDGTFSTATGKFVVDGASGAATFKGAVNLGANASFTSGKYGSINLGDFYDEYRTNVEKYDEAIKDLQDKTQNINKDKTEEGHTQIDGDLTVGDVNAGSGNINAGNVNAGTVNADNVVVGDTTISKDGITSNKVTVGDTTIDKDGITSNKVTVGDTTVSKDSVNVGGENGTTVSKDGVTVGGENGTSVSKDDVVINKGTDKEVSLSNVGSRVDNLEQGLADANSRIDRVDEKIDKVGAMAAAIANLRTMGYDPEAPTEIAVGVGQYRSETGAALGFFHYPNKDFMLSMSVSTSGDEVMGGIGATWKFGRKTPAEMKAAKERVAEKVKLEKAAAIKKAAELAKVEKQQQRHAELAAKKAAK